MGAQISQGLAGLGSKLVLHSRDLSHTRALASRLAQSGVKVVTVAAELSDQRQVEAMLDEVQAKAGPIDNLYKMLRSSCPSSPAAGIPPWLTCSTALR